MGRERVESRNLGVAQAQREFAAFCRTLSSPSSRRAPAVRALRAEIDSLEAEILAAYRPPASIEKYGEFIAASAALKEARELARRFGVTRYPAMFVDDVLVATPKDFGFYGKGEGGGEGRYAPLKSAASHERLRSASRPPRGGRGEARHPSPVTPGTPRLLVFEPPRPSAPPRGRHGA